MSQSFITGMKKGMDIVANPSPERLQKLRENLSKQDMVAEAWMATGRQLTQAMNYYQKTNSAYTLKRK
ncbi:hypothetical protein [Actinotignum urinale]|uniref:Uncharacterized protein n=1 Tax=Actinotignum urinale TaxID=190146 RepID=A0AAW9HRN7_9ACTO|nr:hypothetical protein [Actinotignum urinale]MDY5154314.1 hypothetical protein [Actinotignum urinale]MDY5159536.1 hypothetical protein [Actinotignum urinale]